MNIHLLLQFIVNGIIVGLLYGVVAMSFVLIYKASRVVNFAQGEFLLIGAWTCWWFLNQYQVPFVIALLAVIAVMAILGMLIQVVVLRPLIGEPIISVIMVTIGLSVFFQAMMKWIFGPDPKSFPEVFPVKTLQLAGMTFETVYALSALMALVMIGAFAYLFKATKIGLAMRATAFNQQVASSLGVSVKRMFAVSWAISAVVSGLAGVIVGMVNGVSSGLSSFGLKVFPAVILGGFDSIFGAVAGGLIIGILENLAEFVDGQYLHLGNMYAIAPFYVLVIILMIKPYGLFGTRDIERV